jgi:sugar phosphate isomerase/epimerase
MMNRRNFLKASAGAVMGTLFVDRVQASAVLPSKGSLDKIGVQLYSVRDLMKKDFAGTLEKVAKIGYKEVEFAGYFDNKPEDVRKLLDGLGLKAPAVHVSIDVLRDSLDATLATSKIIGHQYIVCPWLSPADRTLEKYKEHAALFNKVGEACQKAGIQFAYHNHEFEFEAQDGKIPYDMLLADTDPKLVQMELDLFWIRKGGQETLAYFEKHPGRFPLCHVKDMTADQKMVDVGAGTIDFAKIFAQSKQAGLKHYFVEHDEPSNPLQSITASYQHLKQLKF